MVAPRSDDGKPEQRFSGLRSVSEANEPSRLQSVVINAVLGLAAPSWQG